MSGEVAKPEWPRAGVGLLGRQQAPSTSARPVEWQLALVSYSVSLVEGIGIPGISGQHKSKVKDMRLITKHPQRTTAQRRTARLSSTTPTDH